MVYLYGIMKTDNVNKQIMILKQIRSKLNLSQAEVASKLGITQQALARYESGAREFRLSLDQLPVFIDLCFNADLSLRDIKYKQDMR